MNQKCLLNQRLSSIIESLSLGYRFPVAFIGGYDEFVLPRHTSYCNPSNQKNKHSKITGMLENPTGNFGPWGAQLPKPVAPLAAIFGLFTIRDIPVISIPS